MKKYFLLVLFSVAAGFANGQATFQTLIGASPDAVYVSAVVPTKDGGYAAAGMHRVAAAWEIFLSKFDAGGNLLWAKDMGEGTTGGTGGALIETPDSGFAIAASVNKYGPDGADSYFIRTDSKGNILWQKTYGGVWDDYSHNIIQTLDSGFMLTGSSNTNLSDGVYLVKTNAQGTMSWAKKYTPNTPNEFAYGLSTLQVSDGFVITGTTSDSITASQRVLLMKTDTGGVLLWSKAVTISSGTSDQKAHCLTQTIDGGYAVVGSTDNFGAGLTDCYLLKTDSDGNLLWTKTYGGSDYDDGSFITELADGGFAITGRSSSFGAGDMDVLTIRTDPTGTPLWAKTYGTSFYEDASSIKITSDGGFILGGYAGSYPLLPRGYIIKTDSAGTSNCYEVSVTPIVGSGGGVMVALPMVTTIVGTEKMGGTNAATTLPTLDYCSVTGQNELMGNSNLSLYPNPFSSQTTLQLAFPLNHATLTVDNYLGQTVARIKNINGQTIVFNRGDLPSGLYFVHLTQDNQVVATKKIIITD